MASYNSGKIYNRVIPSGGAKYNSAPFSIYISDYSDNIVDNIKSVTQNTSIKDNNVTRIENLTFDFNVNVYDDILILEKTGLSIDTGTRNDVGYGQEVVNNQLNSNYSDVGKGVDNTNLSPLALFLNELSQGTEALSQIISTISTNELGSGVEIINLLSLPVNLLDGNSQTNEIANINSDLIYSDNGNIVDFLSLPLIQVNTSDSLSLTDLINIAFSDINLVDNVAINEFTNISNAILLNDENISAIDIVVYRSGVFYNTRLQYNKKPNNGGAIYNSSKHLIIVVSESVNVDEKETYVVQAYFVYDNGQGGDNSSIMNELPKMLDNVISDDSFKNITNNVIIVDLSKPDLQDEVAFARLIDVMDKIIANDYVRKAETHFIIDSDNILQPLGIRVAKVSEGILPFTKDYTEEIPGKHGEYYLKSEFKGKSIEFEVVTPDGLTPEVKRELKEKFMQYLNPTRNEEKPLTFSDDLEKQYLVRYSGKIDIDNYPNWFKFVIPFKMSNPLIRGSFDNVLIGNGIAKNEGNTDANMIININGLAENPTIELDGQILTYNGTIEYGQTVVIDTEKKTVMMGDMNVLDNWCGVFPTLKPGNTNVIMNGNISIRWRDSWL